MKTGMLILLGAMLTMSVQVQAQAPAPPPDLSQLSKEEVSTPGQKPAAKSTGIVADIARPPLGRTGRKPTARRDRSESPPATRMTYSEFADVPAFADQAVEQSQRWANNEQANVSAGEAGRVVFVYGEAMPTIICAPSRVCEIELQAGEMVTGPPLIGDSIRWKTSPGITGEGATKTVHILVKPTSAGLDTNLAIATNKRMYRLRLVSDAENYVSVVSFYYPEDEKELWDAAMGQQATGEREVIATMPSISADNLDFNFSVKVKSGKPTWVPRRVFTDGTRTYIQMPDSVSQGEAPVLMLKSPAGDDQIVNYRVRSGYYVVDQVVSEATLIAGIGRASQRVTIKRKGT
jgi:type IV secretion system protein VirB9